MKTVHPAHPSTSLSDPVAPFTTAVGVGLPLLDDGYAGRIPSLPISPDRIATLMARELPPARPAWLEEFQRRFDEKYGPTGQEQIADEACTRVRFPLPDASRLSEAKSTALVLKFGGSNVRGSLE